MIDFANQLIYNDIILYCKDDAVPYNYRISYKVSLICLIIGECCGKKGCSATKLQMIDSAVSTNKRRKELLVIANGTALSEITLVRFDPAISRAINYALADQLIYRQGNGMFRLKEKGHSLVNKIYKNSELMIVEKDFFVALSNRLTEEIIGNIAQNWRINNAEDK